MGEISFDVPQVREGGFYPQALEKGLRSERALNLALAERYVQGVSTRKVTAIVEKLCGTGVSSTLVSQAAGLLDETLEAWRNRPLGEFVYLLLDARYEKVRQDGQIRDAALNESAEMRIPNEKDSNLRYSGRGMACVSRHVDEDLSILGARHDSELYTKGGNEKRTGTFMREP